MKKLTKFLMTSVLLLAGAYGISNANEIKEVKAATFAEGEKLYLDASKDWDQAGAWFIAHLYNSSSGAVYDATMNAGEKELDGIYEFELTANAAAIKADKVIFLRMNPDEEGTNDLWDNSEDDGDAKSYWNRVDTTFESGKNLFTITDWDKGEWSTYSTSYSYQFYAQAAAVENDGTVNNAVKVVSALPAEADAMKNGNNEYNVGFKFDFHRTYDVQEEVSGVVAGRLYLNAGGKSLWDQANAWFAVYYWDNNGNHWGKMVDTNSDGIYEYDLPEGYTNIIFCRKNPSNTGLDWNGVWNQTADLKLPTNGNNTYTITGWGSSDGKWSQTTEEGLTTVAKEETKTGYYTCANISLVEGVEFNYEVEKYFAVIVTDIPEEFNGGTMKVTPAYQAADGVTVYGYSTTWTLTVSAAGVTIA